jgi:hypothetical protein
MSILQKQVCRFNTAGKCPSAGEPAWRLLNYWHVGTVIEFEKLKEVFCFRGLELAEVAENCRNCNQVQCASYFWESTPKVDARSIYRMNGVLRWARTALSPYA